MLTLQEVSFSYKRNEKIIQKANIEIPRGYLTALVGRNGAGKTTLLKLLYGALRPQEGKLLCDGEEIKRKNLDNFHDRCAFVIAEGWEVGDRSADWHIDFFDRLCENFDKSKAEELLKKFHFSPEDGRKQISKLSTGQKMQVQIAIAIAKNTEYIIMDEPLANIDPIVKTDILDVIQNAVARGCGVILSTHLMEEIEHLTDQILVIEEGSISGDFIKEEDISTDIDCEKRQKENSNDDCQAIYQLMQEESRYNIRHNIVLLMAFVALLYQGIIGVGPLLTCFQIFLMFAFAYEFYVRNTQLRVDVAVGIDSLSLAEWLRYHKYPARTYPLYLLGKLRPWWCAYGIVLLISTVMDFSAVRILYLVSWAMIPPIVMMIEKAFMQWDGESDKNVGKESMILLLHGIYHICYYIHVASISFFVASGVTILFEDFIHLKGWSETIPTCMTDPYAWFTIVCMVLLITFLFAMSNKDDKFDFMNLFRISGIYKIRLILGVLTLVSMAANIYMFSANYTIFGGDRFVISQWSSLSEYTLDDIESCHMYYASETFHLDVTFTDSKEVKILGNATYMNNDLWTETYDNDYSYALELTRALIKKGISPKLDNEDEIREMIRDYNPNIVRDFEALVKLIHA